MIDGPWHTCSLEEKEVSYITIVSVHTRSPSGLGVINKNREARDELWDVASRLLNSHGETIDTKKPEEHTQLRRNRMLQLHTRACLHIVYDIYPFLSFLAC